MRPKLVFLLEEPSAEALLNRLLPTVLPPGVSHQCVPFKGKQHLEKYMGVRIRAWREPNVHFVVLRDQDSSPYCRKVKQRLVDICANAGRPETLVRIACRTLEAWVLGDLSALVEASLING